MYIYLNVYIYYDAPPREKCALTSPFVERKLETSAEISYQRPESDITVLFESNITVLCIYRNRAICGYKYDAPPRVEGTFTCSLVERKLETSAKTSYRSDIIVLHI